MKVYLMLQILVYRKDVDAWFFWLAMVSRYHFPSLLMHITRREIYSHGSQFERCWSKLSAPLSNCRMPENMEHWHQTIGMLCDRCQQKI